MPLNELFKYRFSGPTNIELGQLSREAPDSQPAYVSGSIVLLDGVAGAIRIGRTAWDSEFSREPNAPPLVLYPQHPSSRPSSSQQSSWQHSSSQLSEDYSFSFELQHGVTKINKTPKIAIMYAQDLTSHLPPMESTKSESSREPNALPSAFFVSTFLLTAILIATIFVPTFRRLQSSCDLITVANLRERRGRRRV